MGEGGRKIEERRGERENHKVIRRERDVHTTFSSHNSVTIPLSAQYVMHMNVRQLDLFDVFQGIQFCPLDKYMYLKVHCFINLIETTFR